MGYDHFMEQGIRIGTSGWSYAHWEELFFPVNHPKSKWLEFYASDYSTRELETWAKKIIGWKRDAYFDNDFKGHAVKNARRLKEILGLK